MTVRYLKSLIIYCQSKTKAMDFLVGYFYFSGIQEIYKNIEDKPMRILVGMDME